MLCCTGLFNSAVLSMNLLEASMSDSFRHTLLPEQEPVSDLQQTHCTLLRSSYVHRLRTNQLRICICCTTLILFAAQ